MRQPALHLPLQLYTLHAAEPGPQYLHPGPTWLEPALVQVTQLSGDLFPGREAQPALVSISVGFMNLIGPWLGALPCCHGAGGLAAQVRMPRVVCR